MTSTDTDLLLQQIIANPDDDTLRLVYADALDEVGGELNALQAELIRTMMEIPDFKLDWSMNAIVYDNSVDARIRRVANIVRRSFSLSMGTRYWMGWSNCRWRRGFIYAYRGSFDGWNEAGDDICKRHPIELVEFNPRDGTFWGDLVSLSTHRKLENRCTILRAEWKAKGKPKQVYEQYVSDRDWDYITSAQTMFQSEVRARTDGVLRNWWPTVREWKYG